MVNDAQPHGAAASEEDRRVKLRMYVVWCAMVAALGGLLFGFDVAVVSGTTGALEAQFSLSPAAKGFTVASALIGTILGALGAGPLADRLGRRFVLFCLALLFVVSAIGCAFAWDWPSLLAFRIIGGLGIGGASVVAPMYISEISPARWRGRLVALAQLNIVLGILVAYLSNYLVSRFELGDVEWRLMFGVEAAPALAFFGLLFFVPRSPRWLMAKGRTAEARRVLERVGVDAAGGVDAEIALIQVSLHAERSAAREPLFQRRYTKPILLVVAIAMFNQLSGINAVLYYAPEIFRSAGADENAALLNSVGLGAMNLLFTLIALTMIDRFGRRFLILVGSVGYMFSLGALSWAFMSQSTRVEDAIEFTSLGSSVVLAGLLLFIASHAVGQGAVIWVFISEIFPNRVRGRGQSLGCFTHWVMAALISQTFPMFSDWAGGGGVFAFYGVCMALQFIWAIRWMPETKDVPLEDIERLLKST